MTVSPARCVSRPEIRVHRTPIARLDVRVRERMRVSSPPRTILELATDLDLMLLELVVAEANYRRLASDEAKGLTVMPVSGRRIREDMDGTIDRLSQALEFHRVKC